MIDGLRLRGFVVASACFLGALALTELSLLGLIVVAAAGAAAYLAWSRSNASTPGAQGFVQPVAMVLAGLTVLAGLIDAIWGFDAFLPRVIMALWALAYAAWSLKVLMPQSLERLAGERALAGVSLPVAVLSVVAAFLIGGFTLVYILWLAGTVLLVRTLGSDGLPGLDPTALWRSSGARLATIGVALAGASLGLTWASWVDYNPGIFDPYANCDYYTGYCMGGMEGSSYYTGDVNGHGYSLDLLPALLLTGTLWWLASARSGRMSPAARRWAPYAMLAVLLVDALWNNFFSQFGPKVFVGALVLVGVGLYRLQARPSTSRESENLGG